MDLITKLSFHPQNSKNSEVECFVDVVFMECIAVRNIKIVSSKEGNIFVSMPSFRNIDGKWEDLVFPVSYDIKKQIDKHILSEYFKFAESKKPDNQIKLPI